MDRQGIAPGCVDTEGADDRARVEARQEVDALNEKAWEIRLSQPDEASRLFLEAADRSQVGPFAGDPYWLGVATSRAGRGLMALIGGRQTEAAHLSLEALSYLADSPLTGAEVTARTTLAWLYVYLGENSTALENAHVLLRQTRLINSPYMEARTHILIGTVHRNMGAGEDALREQRAAVQICRANPGAHPTPDTEALALHHMSDTLCYLGDFQGAIARGLESMDLAHGHGFSVAEFMAGICIIQALLAMGQPDQAEPYLTRIRHLTPSGGRSVFEVDYHRFAGNVAAAKGDDGTAEAEYLQAASLAAAVDDAVKESLCHQQLSELYEARGNVRLALDHLKRFNALQRIINSEQSRQRVAVLHALHQVEAAERETAVVRAQNSDLQKEIEERKRLAAQLEDLASHDPLTQLFNRRTFLDLANREMAKAVRSQQELAFLYIDVDHFKQINDGFGHSVGDQALLEIAARLRVNVREEDLVGRLGGDEFAILLPHTALADAQEAAERIRVALLRHPVATDHGDVHATVSMGIACASPQNKPAAETLKSVMDRADEALLRAKQAGRNRIGF